MGVKTPLPTTKLLFDIYSKSYHYSEMLYLIHVIPVH